MNIYSQILFLTAGIDFILATIFFISSQKQKSNSFFSFFVVFAGLWALWIGLFLNEVDITKSLPIANAYYLSAAGIGVSFLLFAKNFLSKKTSLLQDFIFLLPFLLLMIAMFVNQNTILNQVYETASGKNVTFNNNNYILFGVFFLLYISHAYYLLIKKMNVASNVLERRQTLLIIYSTIVGFICSSFSNLILPWFGVYSLIWIGPLFGLSMVAVILYAITKHQLFNIKTVATEIFIFILWIAVFIQILLEDNTQKQLQSGALLVFLIFFGVLLIKSVIKEVRQRELLQVLKDALQKSNTDLEDANEQLKGLDKLKTEFLSLASHQLRSPLTAIKGYSSMLIEDSFGKIDEHQKEAVKRIYTSAQGLVSIVEDLLDVTKIEQGGMKYQFLETDIKKLVTDLYNEMLIPAQNKGLKFSLNIDEKENYIMSVDSTKLKQVFLNLVDNSIKYTKEGYVKIMLSKTNNSLHFVVQDSGLGVTAETKKRLFQKFSRGEAGKTNTGGSGLGLYIAQKIVGAHKGTITIESEGEGKGAAFIVEIPYI
jgi:signal transduction histidine kinase